MKEAIKDYTIIEVIKEEDHITFFRASRVGQNNASLKILKKSDATSSQIQDLTHEFEIEKNIQSSHAVHSYELVATEELLGFSMEDLPPMDLQRYLNSISPDLENRLAIGMDLCEGVGEIHQANVAHRKLGSKTIYVDPIKNRIKIGDFDQATSYPSEADYIIDLKAIGVILETLFQPFEAIPALTKVMQKIQQGEYHSAFSIRYDLLKTSQAFHSEQTLPSTSKTDIYDHFHIPENLFGRQKELYAIQQWCNDVWNGAKLFLLLSGPIGIGKTALAEQIGKNVRMRQGRFLEVNFDPIKKNVPYKALSRALGALFIQFSLDQESQLHDLRKKIINALGNNAQVIAELIPEIQKIISVEGPVTILTAQENHNRLRFLLIQLFKSLIDSERPLVIFLDNLEFADESTLGLVKDLLSDIQIQHLFIITAFDNRPTSSIYKELANKGENNIILHLEPLSYDALFEMVFAIVPMQSLEESQKLTSEVHEKSKGNPYYALELLKLICEEHLLNFDPENLNWKGDLNQIKTLLNNIVLEEIPARKSSLLNKALLNLFKITTSLETPPEIGLLAELSGQSVKQVESGLMSLMHYGFLNQKNFFNKHAAILFQSEAKDKLHLQIARTLHKHKKKEHSLEIAFYLREVPTELLNEEEKIPLASTFLEAGLKAKNRGAYPLAIQYFTKGISLLPEDNWGTNFDLTNRLKQQLATTFVVNGNYPQAEKLLEECINHATNSFDKCRLYREMVFLYGNLKEFDKLFNVAQEALACYGYNLSVNTSKFSLLKSYLDLRRKMAFMQWDDLTNLPEVTDQNILDILSILSLIFFPAFLTNNKTLFLKTAIDMINLTIDHGASFYAPIPLATYAMILGSSLVNDFENSAACGAAALKMTRRYPKKAEIGGAVCTYYSFIHRWKHPLSECITPLRDNLRLSLETGGGFVGTTNATYLNLIKLLVGDPLDDVQKSIQYSINELKKYSTIGDEQLLFVHREVCKALRGFTNDFTDPFPSEFSEKDTPLNPLNELRYKIWHTILLTIFNRWNEAVAAGNEVLLQKHEFPNWPEWNSFYFYYSLSLASIQKVNNYDHELWKKLQQAYKKLKRWAAASPVNYAHHALLVGAEIEKLRGNIEKAEQNYSSSVASALGNNLIHEAAIALEYYGRFCIEQKRKEQASIHFNQAFRLFSCWGAEAKKREFRLTYSNFLEQLSEEEKLGTEEKVTWTRTLFNDIDINSLLENSISLTQEIQLKNLADSILRLGEQSGSDNGHLILQRGIDALLVASKKKNEQTVMHLDPVSIEASQHQLPLAAVKTAIRSKSVYRMTNPHLEEAFELDPYVLAHKPKNILTIPFIHKGEITGILYLENLQDDDPFTKEKISHLSLLAPQIAIALENAKYYEQIDKKVQERSLELQVRNQELQQTLENVEKIHNQQLQQEKLASLGLLSSGIAHELKNPLNFIINFSEVASDQLGDLEQDLSDEKTFQEDLESLAGSISKIEIHSNRAEDILNRMLEHGRTEYTLTDIDLQLLIEQALELSFTAYQKKSPGYTVSMQKSFDQLPLLHGHPSDLMRVFINLFDNAFYATEQKKKLNPSFEPIISVKTEFKNDSAHIEIEDNGVGISKDLIGKAFQPFFTTKPAGTGTGLGLSISYEIIVKEHHGTIKVSSTPGLQTKFSIELPIEEKNR